MSSSAPFSLTSTLLSQPLHRAQTHPLSPSLHNKASSWSCLPAASSLVSLLPAMQPEGPCEHRSQVMSLPCSGPSCGSIPGQSTLSGGPWDTTQSNRAARALQGMQVLSGVREDPTCCKATKPVHTYWSPHAPEPTFHNEKPTHRN